ncbi:pre-mRNA 3' end processing protein WDR33 isoform X1 [Harmonia axyridis]|uniref:pre-mRNA 3' end processing protein WDR33 isoform X1 n=1 Tax=Harmonia axyridis TaxID=115357 RepID=UPI001E276C8F|nr:pre-mRNA 3' end processing protein WDR33 isoform X1 [Harmonia axyridis]
MEFAQPNLAMPPPNLSGPPPNIVVPPIQGYGNRPQFKPFMNFQRPLPGPLGNMTLEDFDGKRLRKSVMRKTVDYNSAIIKELENRVWQRDSRDRRALQPDVMYYPDMMPPPSYPDNPINCVTTRFVKTATNKMRCPIFCMAWTPEGRRLVTGASSGEFTLWNGLTFNFETILQAHDSPVRTMVWSHNDSWMVTGDHAGYVKYWQSNMNNVKMFQAHKEALRGISFSPSDTKFVTCSDDGTLRIWDFFRYQEEKILRGHGADVKCVHWHPQKSLIVSGSKDNQQPIKLWDPKSGQSLATLHAHKLTVMDLKWNENGNWLITASRDHLLKLFDLRNLSQEVQTFRGHKKEASSVAWHPVHEGLFASGGSDGSIMFWHVGADKEVGAIEQAHDSIVWTLAWHPLGHILCSGSNDHTSKFWTRNRPGDQMRDKYNLNTLPGGIAGLEDLDMAAIEEPSSVIPGMGPEDKVDITSLISDANETIPGLDLDLLGSVTNEDKTKPKKVPFSKPIPRNFQAQWNETGAVDENPGSITEVLNHLVENAPGVVPLEKITPNAIIVYGKLIPVEPGSKLEQAIADGPEALQKYIDSGEIEELHDVMPIKDDNEEDYLIDPADKEAALSGNLPATTGIVSQSASFGNSDNDFWMRNANTHNADDDADISMDVDFRNNLGQDMELRSRDFNMRNQGNIAMEDEDFGQFDNKYGEDEDFREPFEENKDYEEDYYEEPGSWQRNGQSNQFRGHNRNFRGPPPNFRGGGNFNRNERTFGQKDENWNMSSNNFRGPMGDGFRPGPPTDRFKGAMNDNFRPPNKDNFRGPPNNESFRGVDNFRGAPSNSDNFRTGPINNDFRCPSNNDNFRGAPPPNSDNFRGGPPLNNVNFRSGPPNSDNFRSGPPLNSDNFRNGPPDDNFRCGPPNNDNFRGQRGRRGGVMRGGPRGGRSRGRGGPEIGRGRGIPRRGGPNRGGF